MNILIMKSDETVTYEGRTQKVDMREVSNSIHAIRFDRSAGEIEFVPHGPGQKTPNIGISNIDNYTFLIDRWREACIEEDMELAHNENQTFDQKKAYEQQSQGMTAVQKKQLRTEIENGPTK